MAAVLAGPAFAPGAGQAQTEAALTFHLEALPRHADDFLQQYTPDQVGLLEKLNRADLDHLRRMREIVMPDAWAANELAYSPLPARYPSGAPHARLIVVHQPLQAFGAYEYGELVRWGPVSTGGRSHPTPPGVFRLNWRAVRHTSTVDPTWIMPWTFNFENRLGLAFHEYSLPGKPASHACVRLLGRDAVWLFEWGAPGTPVFVVDNYRFDAPPPWRSLEWVGSTVELPPLPATP